MCSALLPDSAISKPWKHGPQQMVRAILSGLFAEVDGAVHIPVDFDEETYGAAIVSLSLASFR